ncbi:uncharacterized protein LOC108737008 [Agrilus planipennis]|uniref:Uncharacterized protein LOC108737008 n=1 Tax=Agrilus planipennis TaxID=224129 RepID=A0A1W4WYK5_AGRPL|nr:uncharacterized protein LOC108737008 [Agrilus planipennis]
MTHLSRQETVLCVVNIILLLLAISMAVCIGFMLPKHIRYDDYVNGAGKTEKEIAKACKCYSKKSIFFTVEGMKGFSNLNRTALLKHPSVKYKSEERLFNHFNCLIDRSVPYLVFALLPEYGDDIMRLKFACVGFIVSQKWVVVSRTCVTESRQWTKLKIRSGTTLWSHGGSIREVVGLGRGSSGELKDLQYLKVDTVFDFNENKEQNVKVLPKYKMPNVSEFYSVGWDRKDSDTVTIEKWGSRPCRGCSQGILTNRQICNGATDGRPLITANGVLVGYLKTRKCREYPGMSVFGDVYGIESGANAKDIEIFGRKCDN